MHTFSYLGIIKHYYNLVIYILVTKVKGNIGKIYFPKTYTKINNAKKVIVNWFTNVKGIICGILFFY